MARKNSKKNVATEVSIDPTVTGKPVDASEITSLDSTVLAHAPVGVVSDYLTKWIDVSQFVVEDDARGIPAHNQHEIDKDRAIDLFIHGQKQPALVYPHGIEDDKFVGVAGHTRARAVKLLNEGFEAVDPRTGETVTFKDADRKLWVAIDATKSKQDAFIDGLITNIKQSSLTPVQEALAVNRLVNKYDYSLTDAARLFGYNNTNRQAKLLTLLELGDEITGRVHAGELSLDAAVSLKGLKSPKRLALITKATGDDGKVDGAKLRGLLRDVYSTGDEEVKNLLDPQYGYSTDAVAPVASEVVEGGSDEESEESDEEAAPKGVSLKRNKSHFDAFADSIINDEDQKEFGEPTVELLKALKKWFNGVKFGDTALKNALKAHVKAK